MSLEKAFLNPRPPEGRWGGGGREDPSSDDQGAGGKTAPNALLILRKIPHGAKVKERLDQGKPRGVELCREPGSGGGASVDIHKTNESSGSCSCSCLFLSVRRKFKYAGEPGVGELRTRP